jgi:hypothetical protein
MIQVITYATHSYGMFDELVNNKYNVDVKVLGWGTKWSGFTDKLKGVLEYIKTLDEDDIIIFVDGFDSRIMKPLHECERRFKELGCKVLFSRERGPFTEIFPVCRNTSPANTGLYMGYVGYLKPILEETAYMKCKDDQTNINKLCGKYSYIEVDTDEKIFYNKNQIKNEVSDTACFIQESGKLSCKRILRGFNEYTQFYILRILIFLFVLVSYYPNRYVISFIILFLTWFLTFADNSCV